MKLYVACAVCSVRRVHGAGYGRAEHMCSRGEPLGLRGLFLRCAGDVMATRVGRNPAGGIETLPDGAVHEGRDTRQRPDVMGKVQRARLRIAVQKRDVRVAALELRVKKKRKKRINLENKSKPRFRVNRIPRSGVKDPLSRGTG